MRPLSVLFFATATLVSLPFTVMADAAYLIQLGSFDKQEEAQKLWSEYNSAYKSQLSGVDHRIATIDLPGKTIYRLQAGPVEGRNAAKNLCNALKPKLDGCLLVETAMLETQRSNTILPANTALAPSNELAVAGEEGINSLQQVSSSLIPQASAAAAGATALASTSAEDAVEAVSNRASELAQTASESALSEVSVAAPTLSQEEMQQALRDGAKTVTEEKLSEAHAAIPVPEVNASALSSPLLATPSLASAQATGEDFISSASSSLTSAGSKASSSALAAGAAAGTLATGSLLAAENAVNSVEDNASAAAKKAEEAASQLTTPVAATVQDTTQNLAAQHPSVAHVDVKEAIRVDPADMPAGTQGGNLAHAELVSTPEDTTPSPLVLPNAEIQKQHGVLEAARARKENVDKSQIGDGVIYWVKMLSFKTQTAALNYWELFKGKRDVFRNLTMDVLAPYKAGGKQVPYTVKAGALDIKEDSIELCLLAREESKECRVIETNDSSVAAVSGKPVKQDVAPEAAPAAASPFLAPTATPEATPAPTSPFGTSSTAPVADAPAGVLAEGQFWIQIGSYDSQTKANMVWEEAVAANGDILGGMKPRITTPLNGDAQGNMYRLRTGAFETRLNAMNFCTKLQARGLKCLVIAEY